MCIVRYTLAKPNHLGSCARSQLLPGRERRRRGLSPGSCWPGISCSLPSIAGTWTRPKRGRLHRTKIPFTVWIWLAILRLTQDDNDPNEPCAERLRCDHVLEAVNRRVSAVVFRCHQSWRHGFGRLSPLRTIVYCKARTTSMMKCSTRLDGHDYSVSHETLLMLTVTLQVFNKNPII